MSDGGYRVGGIGVPIPLCLYSLYSIGRICICITYIGICLDGQGDRGYTWRF